MVYNQTAKQLFSELDSHESGLGEAQVKERQTEYGQNVLPAKPPTPAWAILLQQLKSPLIYILLIAMVITFWLQDYADALVIFLAVFLNTILGFIQEYKAQKAFHELKALLTPQAVVRRNGLEQVLPAAEVVPGDVLVLQPGSKVSADVRLFAAHELLINEAILTGEAEGEEKNTVVLAGEIAVGDRTNMAFTGTEVLAGHGLGLVVAIGLNTELGKIATLLQETKEAATPLQDRLSRLSGQLALIVVLVAFVVFVVGAVAGHSVVEMFTTAVALAVAAIPEGLAVSLTAILALGMQRILKRQALVRKLVAAETLGSTTVICSDKTGTLTEGIMRVTKTNFVDRDTALQVMVLNNNRANQTEVALWDYTENEAEWSNINLVQRRTRLAEVPFSSKNKYMLTLHVAAGGDNVVYAKGAPEVLLSWCVFAPGQKEMWLERVNEYAGQGLRVLALAQKKQTSTQIDEQSKRDYVFLGLVGIEDPPRKGVKAALQLTRAAGIKVIIITGDNRITAEAIMRKVGIDVKSSEVMEGWELAKLGADELVKVVDKVKLFARVSPEHKLLIVDALQSKGEVVAMTGDGVNDAPALKKADIGIVVNNATDVAKEIADMVLLDSNFNTIVAAVEEGRGIFDNIRKIILYLLSDSFSEILLILGALMLRLPLPLSASQILFINLITDGFPNLALTADPKEQGIMAEPPKSNQESLLNTEIKVLITLVSIFTAGTALLIFLYYWYSTNNLMLARSVVFAALGVDSLLYVFSIRSLRQSVWQKHLFDNKWLLLAVGLGFALQFSVFYLPALRDLLQLEPLLLEHWLVVLGVAMLVIMLIEFTKGIFLRQRRGTPPLGGEH